VGRKHRCPGRTQPMTENIIASVSDETEDMMTAAESVRPSSENRETTKRSDEMVEGAVERGLDGMVNIAASKA
jgi:hypothetical protein